MHKSDKYMEKEPISYMSEKKEYPENLDALTSEIFSLLSEINQAIGKIKPAPSQEDLERQDAAKEISSIIVELYKGSANEQRPFYAYDAIIENWRQGLDLLRQIRDEALGYVQIEKIRIEEMYINNPKERQLMFTQGVDALKARSKKLSLPLFFIRRLDLMKEEYFSAQDEKRRSEEARLWHELKTYQGQSDDRLKYLCKVIERAQKESNLD